MLMLNIYKIQYVVHFIIANIFGSMWLPEFLSFFFFFFYQLDFNIADNNEFGCFSRVSKHSMCPGVHDVSHACSEKLNICVS